MSEQISSTTWAIDPVHTRIRFDAKYLLMTAVSGWFREVEGSAVTSKEDFSDCKIDLTIYTDSLYTGIEDRDNHLRSPDFFDVRNYPTIIFRSEKVEKKGDDLVISGILSIKDVTHALAFTARYLGTAKDPRGNIKAGFEIDTVFDRKDFNITWNQFFDKQGILLSDQVNIHCDVQLLRLA